MTDHAVRLVRCFSAVFPALSEAEIRAATPETVEAWDSLAMIQLAVVVDEEFGTTTDMERLPQLMSFGAFLDYLTAQTSSTA
jgi:acyl carrier protein